MLGVAVEDFRHDCGEYPCDEASADNDASYDGKFMHALPLGDILVLVRN